MGIDVTAYIRFIELCLIITAGCSVERSIPFAIFALVIAAMFCMMDFLVCMVQKQIKLERENRRLKSIIAELKDEIRSGNYESHWTEM